MIPDDATTQSGGCDAADKHAGGEGDARAILNALNGLCDHATHWLSAQTDLARAHLRNLVLAVVVGTLAAVVAVAVTIMAALYLLKGAAGAIAALTGAPLWFGQLAVGLLGVGGALLTVGLAVRRDRLKRLGVQVRKYERRRAARSARASRRAAEIQRAA